MIFEHSLSRSQSWSTQKIWSNWKIRAKMEHQVSKNGSKLTFWVTFYLKIDHNMRMDHNLRMDHNVSGSQLEKAGYNKSPEVIAFSFIWRCLGLRLKVLWNIYCWCLAQGFSPIPRYGQNFLLISHATQILSIFYKAQCTYG